jgi:hypothetical protein
MYQSKAMIEYSRDLKEKKGIYLWGDENTSSKQFVSPCSG